eukprot:Hpha_TRINITY_DN36990_c0_g1::TRINITY_DN36990_c0_g1_i1::g.170950::m.170950
MRFPAKADLETFKKKNPVKPKVVFFTNAEKPHLMFKAISTEPVFLRTVETAWVGQGSGDILVNVKKKLPAIMMISKGKTTWYKCKIEATTEGYLNLYDWINVQSQSG